MNLRVKPEPTETEAALAVAFGAAQSARTECAAVAAWRKQSFETYAKTGLPTKRLEAWHYSDLRATLKSPFPLAARHALSRASFDPLAPRLADVTSLRLVLVNGFFAADLSDLALLPAGVTVTDLQTTLTALDNTTLASLHAHGLGAVDPAVALNAALVQDGVVIDVAADAALTLPLEIVHVSVGLSPVSIFTRTLVRVGAGATVTLLETHVGTDTPRQVHDVIAFEIGEGAKVDHVVTAAPLAHGSAQVSSLLATLDAHATFQSFASVVDVSFLRRQSFLRFNGAHASALLSGVNVLGGKEHADTTLVVEHLAPDCQSRETFKHIVDDAATGVFQGCIKVAQIAQKTDGKMSSRAILVGEDAAMYNKPELEIFADDVVCGHGATCGELDEDQVFYAMSRGLPRAVAEALLLEAFVGEVIDDLSHPGIQALVRAQVSARLARREIS